MKRNERKVKNVDKQVVKTLLKWRKQINEAAEEGTRLCTLHPRKGCQPCDSCINFAKCHHYEWEREFIHKKEEYEVKVARRKAREEVGQEKSFKDESGYPCESFEEFCPDRELCQGGENCPWHEE